MDHGSLHQLYLSARASDGIEGLAAFVGLLTVYESKARHALRARLRLVRRRRKARDPGPLLATAREAAAALGPSWNARKVYRITPTLPPGCALRKGGRLYYHLPTLKEWAAQR